MSYAARGLGADSTEEARLRERARGFAVSIWNDYQALRRMGPVRELLATEPYSNDAFTDAYRRLRSGVASRVSSVRVSKREFASLVQAAMAKISTLQIKARALGRADDIRASYPAAERVNRAAQRLLASVRRLISQSHPIRKAATSGAKEGTSGLGFLIAVILIGAFTIPAVVMAVYAESMQDAASAERYANDVCARLQRANGRPCGAAEYQAAYREAIAIREESGVRGMIRDTGRGAADAFDDVTGGAIGEGIGTGLKWTLIIGATAVAGLGFYAAWPYIKGARAPGERFARRQKRRTAAEAEE
jgi:hypothetical protein